MVVGSNPTGGSGPTGDSTHVGIVLRLAVATAIATLAGLVTYTHLKGAGPSAVAQDFTWIWRAARVLLDGQNPYQVIQPTGPYPFSAHFKYPLPVAVLALPLARLGPVSAAALFIGISSFLLAFGLTRHGFQRLPIFLSVPFLWACYLGQTSPLLTAALVMPALSGLFCVKPNLGLAVLAYRPRLLQAVIGVAVLSAAALWFDPRWPIRWLQTLQERDPGLYRIPLTLAGGPLLLLAITRWRQPEARLLLAMSIVPQTFFFYDQLPLWLVARTRLESMALSLLSAVAFVVVWQLVPRGMAPPQVARITGPLAVGLSYLPCLIMVLRRPNEGELPAWVSTVGRVVRGRFTTVRA